jgi:thiamine biosynthesis lipoprotein
MPAQTVAFEAIGTHWSVHIDDTLTDDEWQRLKYAITNRIEQFDRTYSRFRHDSLVSRIASTTGTYDLPDDAAPMLDFYRTLYLASSGLVTPLIGRTLSDAGYDAEYSLQQLAPLKSPPSWEESLVYTDSTLTVTQPVLLDFGAAGKGYLVDLIGTLIESMNIRNYTIDASGDILHRCDGSASLIVGLENPVDTSEAIGTIELHNASLCASSGSRRKWGSYHHIINPTTLTSPTEVLATWVLAPSTMIADGLATALFFVAPNALPEFVFDYAILKHDMSIEYSKWMPLTLFGDDA